MLGNIKIHVSYMVPKGCAFLVLDYKIVGAIINGKVSGGTKKADTYNVSSADQGEIK